MTTIVYDHENKLIAVDGRVTEGGMILCNSYKKWIKSGDHYWFLSGLLSDQQILVDCFNGGPPAGRELEAAAFMVSGGQVYLCVVSDDGVPAKSLLSYSDTAGSGRVFSMAAMDHGKTAKEAVEYAATRDTGTGGKVSVFDVERMEFIE